MTRLLARPAASRNAVVAAPRRPARPDAAGDVPDAALRGVTKAFGDVVAVDAVDLDIARGEFLALIGPSGCGKTTTLRLIAGFEQPTAGEIEIGGRPAAGVPAHKRDVNTVFQQYALFPHLTVLDNVAYGLKQRGVRKAERHACALEALELVQLPDYGHRRPSELSGGQQQRVALARALVLRPRVLLLDEPLGALDLKLRKAMQVELKRIQREVGITFVVVTHDQEEAMAMADRVAVLHGGRIEQVDDPQVVYDRPATEFVADFIGEMNRLRGTLGHRDGGAPFVITAAGFQVPVAHAITSVANGARVRAAVRPEDLRASLAGASEGDGVVVEGMTLGHSVQLLVRLHDGQELTVRQPRDASGIDAPPPPGTVVALAINLVAPILLGIDHEEPA